MWRPDCTTSDSDRTFWVSRKSKDETTLFSGTSTRISHLRSPTKAHLSIPGHLTISARDFASGQSLGLLGLGDPTSKDLGSRTYKWKKCVQGSLGTWKRTRGEGGGRRTESLKNDSLMTHSP